MTKLNIRTIRDVKTLDEHCRKLYANKDVAALSMLLPGIDDEITRCDKEFNELCKDVLCHQLDCNMDITALKNQLASALEKQKKDLAKISRGIKKRINIIEKKL